MSDENHSGSFAHAFLPGLILGLVIGAVAGAFLPDWIGGSKIPAPTGEVTPGERTERDGMPAVTEDDVQGMLEEADGAAEGTVDPADEDGTNAETPPPGSG